VGTTPAAFATLRREIELSDKREILRAIWRKGRWQVLKDYVAFPLLAGPGAPFVVTGNLSHQIEHHLFPDIPAHRDAEIAVEVREICQRYGLRYNTGPLHKQFGSVVRKIFRLALPDSDRQPARASAATTALTAPEPPIAVAA
jgi:fatty acid desaturase